MKKYNINNRIILLSSLLLLILGSYNVGAVNLIDTTIDGYSYVTNDSPYKAYYKSNIQNGDSIRYCMGSAIGNTCFIYQPQDLAYTDETGSQDYITSIQSSPIQIQANKVLYNNIFPNINVSYTNDLRGITEYYILDSVPRQPALYLNITDLSIGGYIKYDSRLRIESEGVTYNSSFTTYEDIEFYYGDELVYSLNKPYVIDNNDIRHYNVYYQVVFQDNEIFFYKKIPYSYLETASYPIRIDPSIAPGTYYLTINASETWTRPSYITNATVYAIGGGGGGGNIGGTNNVGAGGGAGGQIAISNLTLTESSYTITIGAGGTANGASNNNNGLPGGDTSFGTLVIAKGGAGGGGGANGAGGVGSATGGTGTTIYRGGSGAAGNGGDSGAGGGGAGTTGQGGDASGLTAGTGTSLYGGNGGAGQSSNSNGNPGVQAGGGGAGGRGRNNEGGTGGAGSVIIKYEIAPITLEIHTANNTIFNNTIQIEFTGTDPDNYRLEYEIQIDNTSDFNPQPAGSLSYYYDNGTTYSGGTFWTDGNLSTFRAYGSSGSSESGFFPLFSNTAPSESDIPILNVSLSPWLSEFGTSGGTFNMQISTDSSRTEILENLISYTEPTGTEPTEFPKNITHPASGWTWNQTKNLYVRHWYTDNNLYVHDFFITVYHDSYSSPLYEFSSTSSSNFTNTINASDTSPFISGNKILFNYSELDEGNYSYRVRTRDPSGTNIWTDWSDTRNFTFNIVEEVSYGNFTILNHYPSNNSQINADSTFEINSTIKCVGGSSGCGNAEVYLYYLLDNSSLFDCNFLTDSCSISGGTYDGTNYWYDGGDWNTWTFPTNTSGEDYFTLELEVFLNQTTNAKIYPNTQVSGSDGTRILIDQYGGNLRFRPEPGYSPECTATNGLWHILKVSYNKTSKITYFDLNGGTCTWDYENTGATNYDSIRISTGGSNSPEFRMTNVSIYKESTGELERILVPSTGIIFNTTTNPLDSGEFGCLSSLLSDNDCNVSFSVNAGSNTGNYTFEVYVNSSISELFYSNQTTIDFIVPGTISFSISLPSSGCTYPKGDSTNDGNCDRAYFESTDLVGTATETNVAPQGQDGTTAFMRITNTGDVAFDLNVRYTAGDFPASLLLKTKTDNSPTGSTTLTTTSQTILSNLASSSYGDLWFWVDFDGRSGGTSYGTDLETKAE